MTKMLRTVIGGALLALLSQATVADTLSDIYQLAVENDPVLRAARAQYMAGREAMPASRAALLPQISAVGEYSETDLNQSAVTILDSTGAIPPLISEGDIDSDEENYGVTLSQPLFDLPAWFTFQQGKALSDQAKALFAADQQALITRVSGAYFNVLRASENLATSEAEEAAIGRQLEQTRERFEVGLLPITDVHEAQAAYDDAAVNTLESRGALDIAFEALEVLTGQTHTELAGLVEKFPIRDPEPSNREDWVRFSLENNFELQAAQYAATAAQGNARAKKMEHLPTVTGNLSYFDNSNDGDRFGNDFSNDQEGKAASIQLQIPIFTGGLVSSQRRQAYHEYVNSRENVVATRRNTVQQARSQHLEVTTNAARVKARKQAITSAESALEATQAGYDVGTRNIVDVLVAQRNLYQARRNYANARFDYIGSLLELKRVAGQLSPDDIYQLNAWLDPASTITRAGVK